MSAVRPLRPRPEALESPVRLLPHAEARSRPRLAAAWWVATAVSIAFWGFILRLWHVQGSDFPLHDGGLFYQMVGDLLATDLELPLTTSYNAEAIPFAYPPLGFYVAALIEGQLGVERLQVLRFLPLAVSTATILAFALLARRFFEARLSYAVAVFAFAVLPGTFVWFLTGGGLTRSFGFLFALLGLTAVHAVCRGGWRLVPVAGVLAALTLLSHLEMALFFAVSAALIFAFVGRDRRSFLRLTAAATIAFAVTAPWWWTVYSRHGAEVLFAAGGSRTGLVGDMARTFLGVNFTGEAFFPVLGGLVLLGVVVSIARREWLLPAWLLAVALLAPWLFPRLGSVAMALLIAVALGGHIVPLLQRAGRGPLLLLDSRLPEDGASLRRASAAILVVLAMYSSLGALFGTPSLQRGLSHDERRAMAWIATNTPPESRFLVIETEPWWNDTASEWFPAVAGRQSVATVQGREWQPRLSFAGQIDAYDAAQDCAQQAASCLDDWVRSRGVHFDHVYITKTLPWELRHKLADCCLPLRSSLHASRAYEVVYDGPGASVFRRR